MFKLAINVYQVIKKFNSSVLKEFCYIFFVVVLDLPTKDICGFSKSELTHAYIMTPAKLSPGTSCECTLNSNYVNGQILLRRVDMKV